MGVCGKEFTLVILVIIGWFVASWAQEMKSDLGYSHSMSTRSVMGPAAKKDADRMRIESEYNDTFKQMMFLWNVSTAHQTLQALTCTVEHLVMSATAFFHQCRANCSNWVKPARVEDPVVVHSHAESMCFARSDAHGLVRDVRLANSTKCVSILHQGHDSWNGTVLRKDVLRHATDIDLGTALRFFWGKALIPGIWFLSALPSCSLSPCSWPRMSDGALVPVKPTVVAQWPRVMVAVGFETYVITGCHGCVQPACVIVEVVVRCEAGRIHPLSTKC